MPWKLVGFIICLVLGTCFAGFNLGNSCNISFGFKTFENVPIFFSLIVAFALGVMVTLPFTVIKKKSAKDRKAQAEERAMKKESARAKMRMIVKKLLKKYKYPPEGQDDALKTVISQCELWIDVIADFDAYPMSDGYGVLKVAEPQLEYMS